MTHNPSRRRFLVKLGAAAGVGFTAPVWLNVAQRGRMPFAWAAGESDVLPSGTPICVHIALDGGNDYLNTLVPVEDGFYRDAAVGHGAIALGESDTLALADSPYRLHNGLAWLADRWNAVGDVGFALGVGNLTRNFSHFDSMKYWSTGRVDVRGRDGWLGRFADRVRPQNPLASVSMTDLRLEAVGRTAPVLVVQECAGFNYATPWLSSETYLHNAKQMAQIPGSSTVAEVARMMGTTFEVVGRIKGADDPTLSGSDSGYKNLPMIGKQLVQAAQLIRAGIPAQSYTVGFGPFDSHTNQRQMQAERFAALNEALARFFQVIDGHPRAADVFVVITSEFGRQVTANRDNGTDHGQAGMAVFVGAGVRRGVFGEAPTLDPGGPTRPNRVHDALKPMVDFRSVHATVLNRLAGGDAHVGDEVLGAHFEDLGVFAATAPPSTTTTTTLANQPPKPVMALSPTRGAAPLTVNASAAGSTDPDGTIAKIRWIWGDGTPAARSEAASHTFTRPGTYKVRLRVRDDDGAMGEVMQKVVVT